MISGFSRTDTAPAATPIMISVPHAGRHYPAALADQARLSEVQLRCLEDRFADVLAEAAAEAGHGLLVANTARAWIDLNRDEDELDSAMLLRDPPHGFTCRATSKVRGGLGLIPHRIAHGGDIWKGALTGDDVRERLESVHRPYHAALGAALEERRRRFGVAILIDLHSMPPIPPSRATPTPHIVIGNRYGRSAAHRITDCVLSEVTDAGFRAALNTPYAGGYVLERHARPRGGIHALQIEVDRTLYLDGAFDLPSKGAATISQLILRIANALAEEALGPSLAIAAE